MIKQYLNKIRNLVDQIEKDESAAIGQAAGQIAHTINNGGIVHLFGCGHSHLLAEEFYYRAGGLVPVHPILHEALMLHEDVRKASRLERENGYAKNFLNDGDIHAHDTLIVISASGRNPVPIDVALHGKKHGANVIGLMSVTYAKSQPSRHTNGQHLFDVVDLVLDNHVPIGDAIMTHEKVSSAFTPSSTVIGLIILHAIFSEAIGILADMGVDVPVLQSGNMEGGLQHNEQVLAQYMDKGLF